LHVVARDCSLRTGRMFRVVIATPEINVGKAAESSAMFGRDLFAVE
jgi:hypothetical protein